MLMGVGAAPRRLPDEALETFGARAGGESDR
jgi:hypothetical protein